jgi:signal transduction histidine kinase
MKHFFTGILFLLLHAAYGQGPTITQLRGQLAHAGQDTTRIRLYTELARLYNKQEKPDSTYFLATEGIALARQYGLTIDESRLFLHLGYYYKRISQYAKAQSAYQTGLRLGQHTGNTSLRSDLLYRLAAVYGDQGMYHRADKTALASLQMAEQLKDSVRMCTAGQLLALVYIDVHDLPLAQTYAHKMYELARQIVRRHPEEKQWLLLAESTVADTYEANNQYARAYPYLKKVFDYFDAANDKTQLSEAAVHLAKNLINQKRPQEALRTLQVFSRRNLFMPGTSDIDEINALAYQQLNRPKTALVYAEKAYKMAVVNGHFKQIQSTLNTLISLEENQKLYPEVLTHLRQLNVINDRLFTLQKSEAIAEVEAKYRLTEQQQTIELLRKDALLRKISLDKKQKELTIQHRTQLSLVIITLVLMLVVGGLIIIFRRERTIGRLLATQKAEIEDKANQLQQLNTLKDKLFGIIAHDLRSPIANLKLQLMGVQEGYISATNFSQRTSTLAQMVDDVYVTLDNLLHWSMLQRSSLRVHPVETDLAELADAVVRLYRNECQAKQLTLSTQLAPTMAKVDEHQVQIVIRNLFQNAIKFTPEGGHIWLTTGHDDGQAVVVIRDSGVGMEPDSQPVHNGQVLSSRGTAGERGTGLGLELCREFVRLNQGQLAIDSRPGSGTTITIRFTHEGVHSSHSLSNRELDQVIDCELRP